MVGTQHQSQKVGEALCVLFLGVEKLKCVSIVRIVSGSLYYFSTSSTISNSYDSYARRHSKSGSKRFCAMIRCLSRGKKLIAYNFISRGVKQSYIVSFSRSK